MAARPQVYLHVEFGVSWSPKRQPRHRQVTYRSSGLREQEQHFPRQLPPVTTNYLSTAAESNALDQQRQLYQYQIQQYPYQHYYYQPESHRQANSQSRPAQLGPAPEEARRSSRSLSRPGSHGRGRSAPPPLNDSPWDAEPEPMTATALPPRRKPVPVQDLETPKASPPSASQISLASNLTSGPLWSYALDYLENSDDSDTRSPSRFVGVTREPTRRSDEDRERGRVREIESLATALMTVDNGFEDQWWYQGPRLINVSGELRPSIQGRRGSVASDSGHVYSTVDGSNLAWEFMPGDQVLGGSTPISLSDLVSPLSDTLSLPSDTKSRT